MFSATTEGEAAFEMEVQCWPYFASWQLRIFAGVIINTSWQLMIALVSLIYKHYQPHTASLIVSLDACVLTISMHLETW